MSSTNAEFEIGEFVITTEKIQNHHGSLEKDMVVEIVGINKSNHTYDVCFDSDAGKILGVLREVSHTSLKRSPILNSSYRFTECTRTAVEKIEQAISVIYDQDANEECINDLKNVIELLFKARHNVRFTLTPEMIKKYETLNKGEITK